ncbi:MAG: DUF1924 domain-containing protein [Alcaligenaceae bacterium]|nr:DUF1924 domain-containing protein [Alcaligenaceae bacterium]
MLLRGNAYRNMAPAANDKAFTDTAKINKWFRRNCKNVLPVILPIPPAWFRPVQSAVLARGMTIFSN